jgi:hypothetical protein
MNPGTKFHEVRTKVHQDYFIMIQCLIEAGFTMGEIRVSKAAACSLFLNNRKRFFPG